MTSIIPSNLNLKLMSLSTKPGSPQNHTGPCSALRQALQLSSRGEDMAEQNTEDSHRAETPTWTNSITAY